MDAAANPLPKDETTPPVTKMYFADIRSSPRCGWKSVPAELAGEYGSETPPHAFPGRAGLNRIGVHNQLWQKSAHEYIVNFRDRILESTGYCVFGPTYNTLVTLPTTSIIGVLFVSSS